jgi:hypothetical protein
MDLLTSRIIFRMTIAIIAPLFLIVLGMRNPYLQKAQKPQQGPGGVLVETSTNLDHHGDQKVFDDSTAAPAPAVTIPFSAALAIAIPDEPTATGFAIPAGLCARGSPYLS